MSNRRMKALRNVSSKIKSVGTKSYEQDCKACKYPNRVKNHTCGLKEFQNMFPYSKR